MKSSDDLFKAKKTPAIKAGAVFNCYLILILIFIVFQFQKK